MYPSDGHVGEGQGQERSQPLEGLEWGPRKDAGNPALRSAPLYPTFSISFCPLFIYFFGCTMHHLSSLNQEWNLSPQHWK